MNYIFKTTATMKEYNNKKWYIDGGIVSDMRIDADSVENALEIYRERVQNKLVMLSRVKQNLTGAIIPGIAHSILICE